MFLIGIILYISVTLPTLRSVVAPIAEESIADQREALTVLVAGNTLIVLCLLGILLLQVRTSQCSIPSSHFSFSLLIITGGVDFIGWPRVRKETGYQGVATCAG